MSKKIAWKCEFKRGACRNPYGCHCKEIQALHDRLTAIQAQGGGEPVAWRCKDRHGEHVYLTCPKTAEHYARFGEKTALYAAPPAPAVPAEDKLPPLYADEPPPSERRMGYNQGWNACREAMLAAAPKPQTQEPTK